MQIQAATAFLAQDYGLLLLVAGLMALLDAVNLLTSLTVIPLATLGIYVMSWQVVDMVMIHRGTKQG
jgi:surface polysaccharide O-acyltransferase-like enzyme